MLINFPTPKNYNLSGLTGFKFVHPSAVSSWPGIFDKKILTPIVLNGGLPWLDGYSTYLTLLFTEEVKESEHGKYYEQQISGFVPGDKLELIELMDLMDDKDFAVLVKDAGGQTRLVGSHGFPLTFSSSYSSGAGRDEAKGYNFKFTGVSTFRAPVYL